MQKSLGRIYLKKPEINELDYRIKICSDKTTMSYNEGYGDNGTGCYYFSKEEVKRWYKDWVLNSDNFYAYIFKKDDNMPIGEVNFHYDFKRKIYMIGIIVEADYRGCGYGGEALKLLVEKSFYEYNLKEIANDFPKSRVDAENLHLKIGFKRVADDLLILTKSDYENKIEETANYLIMTKNIIDELGAKDVKIKALIEKHGQMKIRLNVNYFESLASSIVGQQLSNKVASIIWDRIVKLFNGNIGNIPNTIKAPSNYKVDCQSQIRPESILSTDDQSLRNVGLSINKIAYLKCLSRAVVECDLDLNALKFLSDQEIINELIRIKGIGRWTAEMFLIFSLGRVDVFSNGDIGLYNAICKLYNLDRPTRIQINEITNKWKPYRTFACLLLWKSLENEL